MNIIEQLIEEKQEAITKTIKAFETLRTEATSSNLYAMRSSLIERAKTAESLLIKQEEITDEAYELLDEAEEDTTIPEIKFNLIEDVAIEAGNELSKRQDLYDAYKEAIKLLDKLADTFRWIEAQEEY